MAAILLLMVGASACKEPLPPLPAAGDRDDRPGVNCGVDESLSIVSPYAGAFGTELSDTFCPQRDRDFWQITTSGETKIVTAELTYQKLTNIRMSMQWFGPSGICLYDPLEACTTLADCNSDTKACDTSRRACRPRDVAFCALDRGCSAGTTCDVTTLTVPVNSALEDLGSGATTLHRLKASFAAIEQGDYVISVYDNNEQEADEEVEYSLTLTEADEPDVNEPNDYVTMATPLTSGDTVTAYLATEGDEDWYTIDHSVTTPPVITIDLRWPVGTDMEPMWTLRQGDTWAFPSSSIEEVGLEKIRRATLVAPGTGPFTVQVENSGAGPDTQVPYTLSVSVIEDTQELNSRNDTPETATVFNLNAAGSGSAPTRTETIIAENDRDWFRIDTATSTNNSLLWMRVVGTPNGTLDDSFEYLLEASLYKTCIKATECPSATLCIDDPATICLGPLPWFKLPAPDGNGNSSCGQDCDPSRGGQTPNRLETQVPIRDPGQGALYLLVNHIASTPVPLVGHSATQTYTVELSHKAEPDNGDLNNEDSRFVSRPLQGFGAGKGDFFIHNRELGAGSTAGGGANPTAFALLVPGSSATEGSCTPVTIKSFGAAGGSGTGITVDLGAGVGSFQDGCGGAAITQMVVSDSQIVGYVAPASAPGSGLTTITLTVGGTGVNFSLPIIGSGGTPPPYLSMSGANTAIIGVNSGEIRVALSEASTADVILDVTHSNSVVSCNPVPVSASELQCPNIDANVPVTLTNECPNTGTAAMCELPVVIDETTYDFLMQPTASPGLRIVTVSDSAGGYVPATWVVAARNPVIYDHAGGSGYISYSGDNDFFQMDLPADFDPGKLSVHVSFTGSVNLRTSVTRERSPAGYCRNVGCGISVRGSGTEPGAQCGYTFRNSTGPILNVWVNDENHNDWDESQAYSFDVDFVEGCPAECSAFVCSQGN